VENMGAYISRQTGYNNIILTETRMGSGKRSPKYWVAVECPYEVNFFD
jgi:ribosomal protein L16/L10AE